MYLDPKTIRPIGDRCLVEVSADDKVTEGGIHLPPNMAKEAIPYRGVVLAVGDGFRDNDGVLHPIERVAVGDTVLWGRYTGTAINDDKRHLIVSMGDAVASVEQSKDTV